MDILRCNIQIHNMLTYAVVFELFEVHVDDVRTDAVHEVLRVRDDHEDTGVPENKSGPLVSRYKGKYSNNV